MAVKAPGLILACGCEVRFVDNEPPSCATHGPQRVTRTVRMTKPKFTGVATGPHVKTMDLAPFVGRIVESES